MSKIDFDTMTLDEANVIDPTDPESEVRAISQVQERLQSRFKGGLEVGE